MQKHFIAKSNSKQAFGAALLKSNIHLKRFYDFIPFVFQKLQSPSGIQGEPSPEKPLQVHRLHPVLTGIEAELVHAHSVS